MIEREPSGLPIRADQFRRGDWLGLFIMDNTGPWGKEGFWLQYLKSVDNLGEQNFRNMLFYDDLSKKWYTVIGVLNDIGVNLWQVSRDLPELVKERLLKPSPTQKTARYRSIRLGEGYDLDKIHYYIEERNSIEAGDHLVLREVKIAESGDVAHILPLSRVEIDLNDE